MVRASKAMARADKAKSTEDEAVAIKADTPPLDKCEIRSVVRMLKKSVDLSTRRLVL